MASKEEKAGESASESKLREKSKRLSVLSELNEEALRMKLMTQEPLKRSYTDSSLN